MFKRVIIYIIYTIWILILTVNTIFLFLTWKNTLLIGNLYKCNDYDKKYVKENADIDYDFDYISVGMVFDDDYRVIAVKKNFINFPNIISGTDIIVQVIESEEWKIDNKVYNYFDEKLESAQKVDENMFYTPLIIIYIICGILYIFIKRQLDQL